MTQPLQPKRDYQRLKTMADFARLDAPIDVSVVASPPPCPWHEQMVLRMLVKPRYGDWHVPASLMWLAPTIERLARWDVRYTGILNHQSWCYVTVRHGPLKTATDDQWHFDGASFRVELIPERNYIWANHTGTEYKTGSVQWPSDFDPVRHNLFTYAAKTLESAPIQTADPQTWHMLNPFCLHRRAPSKTFDSRTFVRIAFTEVEGRDINNTPNPLLDTPAYGRDPVRSFRDKLIDYPVGP